VKVYVYPADSTGCGQYRMTWPAEALQRRGHNVIIVPPAERQWHVDMLGPFVVEADYPRDADVIVFQRVTHVGHIELAKFLRKRNVAVVLDVDDDMSNIHPRNVAFSAYHPRNRWREHDDNLRNHSWHHIMQLAQVATLVTVSTPTLLDRYAGHGRGRVLYNQLPPHFLRIGQAHQDSDVLGWSGAMYNHPNDPQVTRPAIGRLVREGHHLIVCGPEVEARSAFGLPHAVETLGDVPFNDWPRQISRFGVGIAPLADTAFNAAKSWLKYLELLGAGVPVVASPRVEYRRLHEEGAGLLAEKPKDWYRKTKQLLTSPGLREEQTGLGLEVAARHVIDDHCEKWWEAWTFARQLQDAATRVALAERVAGSDRPLR
jgi:Glycosyl transferases group 1